MSSKFLPLFFLAFPRHGPSLALALRVGHQQVAASFVASSGPAAGGALQLGEAEPTPGADLRAAAENGAERSFGSCENCSLRLRCIICVYVYIYIYVYMYIEILYNFKHVCMYVCMYVCNECMHVSRCISA